ncbi:hypothetical protein KER10_25150 [Escherichia coli]|nr:hypothetical protein [Escherichia coli]
MIAELSAAMAAIKETAGLAKVINDAKTDAEVKAATIELQNHGSLAAANRGVAEYELSE